MFQAIGLSTHVWNNFLRSALLLAGFPVLLTLLSFGISMVFAYSAGSVGEGFVVAWHRLPAYLAGACLVSLIWFAIAWLANQRIIDAVSGARPATRETDRRLWDLMETLCISRGETMPRLAVIETAGRNAFASGLDRGRGNITVTTGLVEALDDRELSAVLAHELTHIRNGDARLAVIAAVFTGVITLGFDLMRNMRWFSWRGGSRGSGGGSSGSGGGSSGRSRSGDSGSSGSGAIIVIIGIVIIVLAGLLSTALRLALSRNREYLADAGAVQITGDADAMITALRKISLSPALPGLPGQVKAMLLENPEGTKGGSWWATHPPVEDRIAALVRFAGGRDPGPLAVAEAAVAEAPPPSAGKPRLPWGGALPLPIPGLPGARGGQGGGQGGGAPPTAAPPPTPPNSFSDEVAAMRAKLPPGRPEA